ncbi:unnamed protein product [Urochloa humidicola]
MPGLDVDLNVEAPELGQLNPIDWDDIVEFDGPAHELDYDMVWNDGIQDQAGDENAVQGERDGHAAAADAVQGEGDGHAAAADAVQGEGDGHADVVQGPYADVMQGDASVSDVSLTFLQGSSTNAGSSGNKRRFYTDELKIAVYLELLARTDPPILRRGVTKAVSEQFDVPLRVVQSIWKNGQAGGINQIVNKWSRNCGRKRIQIDLEAIKDIPLRQRSTFQDLANALGVKKSTLHNRFKEGYFRRHTNDLKFSLTDVNKIARVKYCLSMLNALSFNPMYNVMYIDEKWFYRTRRNQKYYLANDEQRPERTVKSKNFIEKVMFLAVVTRPRFDQNGNCTFDGKIGIFPFIKVEPAKRWSPNRDRGVPVTKAMTSVTKEVSRDFLVNKVLPALKAKWPAEERGKPIFIQ